MRVATDRLSDVAAVPADDPVYLRSTVALCANLGSLPLQVGNLVTLYTDYGDSISAMTSEAARAQRSVDVEFYIAAWDEETSAFFDALAGRDQLVVALRADRIGVAAAHPGFARVVERGLYLLNPMTAKDLRACIEGPAQQAGLLLEPGLVDLLLREVEGEPGALPLLSHTLRETWTHREGRTLTVDGYQATGGIQGAVAAFFLTGAAPIVRRIPDSTVLTFSSAVGVS